MFTCCVGIHLGVIETEVEFAFSQAMADHNKTKKNSNFIDTRGTCGNGEIVLLTSKC